VFLEPESKFEVFTMTIKKFTVLIMALALPFALMSCSDDPVRVIDVDNGNGDNGNGNGDVTEIGFPITFEEDISWEDFITDFEGGELSVIDNPDQSGINTSDRVARMVKGDGESFAGSVFSLTESIDFTDGTDFTFSVWAPRENTRMLFKIENEDDGSQAFEQEITIAESGEWVDVTFSMGNANQSFTYEKLVFIFDLGTVGDGSADFTWYFDNIRQEEGDGGNGGNGGDAEALTLPVTFDDDNVNYALTDFGGNISEVVDDPTDGSNKVAQTVKANDAEEWAGTTMGGDIGFENPIPFTSSETTMSVRVWSPTADTPIRLKVEDANDPTISVETETNTTVAEEWETLVFDFSNEAPGTAALNLASNYNLASIFFNFGTTGAAAGEQTYYWDDVEFGGESDGGNGGNGGDPATEPANAAPTPTEDPANVISLFSEAYSDVNVDTWRTPWSNADYEEVTVDGTPTKKYSNLDFVGIETTSSPIDASGMDYFHIDVWSANASLFRVKLVDLGSNVEGELPFVIAQGEWVSLKIPLSEFADPDLVTVPGNLLTARNSIQQLILSGTPTGELEVYVDNIYFSKDENGDGGNGDDGNGDATGLNQPIDFEDGGFGADWTWTVFENDSNPPLEIIDNPDPAGINTTSKVAQFTALETGGAFAGFETVEGQLGEFLFTSENCVVTVDVWKSVTSNVSVKFDAGAPPNDWGTALVTSVNSETDQWETLTFNFCEVSPEQQNPPEEFGGLKRIAIFPDNEERDQNNVIYIDNITFSAE
jgi:hypothetical protein